MNSYRKYPGEVGPRAKALIQQWKALVRDEEVDEGKGAPGEEGSLVKEEPGHEEEDEKQEGEEKFDFFFIFNNILLKIWKIIKKKKADRFKIVKNSHCKSEPFVWHTA